MSKKEILRKILSVVFWLVVAYLSVCLLFRKLNTFLTIFLIICYIICLSKLIFKALNFKSYSQFKKDYNLFKAIHEERYRLYFSSDKENLSIYSQVVENYGKFLLDEGNIFLASRNFNQKQLDEIQDIINKVTILMEKEFVTF